MRISLTVQAALEFVFCHVPSILCFLFFKSLAFHLVFPSVATIVLYSVPHSFHLFPIPQIRRFGITHLFVITPICYLSI